MTDDGTSTEPDPDISKPCNRKSCKICSKFVYFHQPILCCFNCRDIFHGTCLKLTNHKVFILQQLIWSCINCGPDKEVSYSCETCFNSINIYTDNFVQCKQCDKIVHKVCLQSNLCLSCLPVPGLVISDPVLGNVCDDYYTNQPYFTPFNYYTNEIVDFLPEADALSENLQNCSEILSSCSYFNVQQFNDLQAGELEDCCNFIGINIDGFKKNFDKFCIFNSKINSECNIKGYFICETNVTESESQTFFLEGYNKFVLDRFKKADNNYKHKGSGLVIFLHQAFENVKIICDFGISTPDFECLCLDVVTNTEKFVIIAAYRSPNFGNFDNFITQFNSLL